MEKKIDEKKKKVGFVVNPIAGNKNKEGIPQLIDQQVDKDLTEYFIEFSKKEGHAREMAKQAAEQGYDMVFAIGGDGTVNEVAAGLMGSPTALGIVPMGSGNGLARHMGIPLQLRKAIDLVNAHRIRQIDSCAMNGKPFFVTAGVGFDAHIGHLFATSEKRGFSTYIKQTLTEYMNYKPQRYQVTINDEAREEEAFLISFANAGQYGNNAYISPHADIQDGKIDVCVMKPFHPLFGALDLGIRLFTKRMDGSKSLKISQTQSVKLDRDQAGFVHLDGEPFEMPEQLEISVSPKSLNVVTAA